MTKLSRRVLEMEESVTLATSARAKTLKAQGRDVLELSLGQPDFVTPKNIQLLQVFLNLRMPLVNILKNFMDTL